jgi:hypothetical protein
MAITSNTDLINTYDGNFLVTSTNALGGVTPQKEHAAQCLAIEVLRSLIATGMSVADYNNLPELEWTAICETAFARAALNINAPLASLTVQEHTAACNLGGNYFEHGYQFIMDGVQPQDKITFTRIGGL